MLLAPHILILTLALVPSLVSSALYPKDSLVKMVDTRGFRNALKDNRTCLVAFVASWCGYCKAMVPEYNKAALGLHPLVPLYAIDCDENRSLCAEHGVKGFPTLKLFPRGNEQTPILFEHPDRTASAFFYFASRRVPHKNKKLHSVEEIEPWVNDRIDQTRVLLLTKAKEMPLMWKVLANEYRDDFAFATHRDRNGKSSVALGYDAGVRTESKILVYPAGIARPFLFEGVLKYNSISYFFDSILDGTANLTATISQPPESHRPTPEEEEIERKQEVQRLALVHGGFSDIIDFEKVIKEHGTGFHETHDHTSRSDDTSRNSQDGEEDIYERGDNPIQRAIRIQLQKEEREAKDTSRDSTSVVGDANRAIFEVHTTTESSHLSTTINVKEPLQTPEACVLPGGVTDRVGSPCVSPASETLPTYERRPTPESGHVKDEL